MSLLVVNPDVLVSPVEGGYVAFDVAREKLYHLNPIAALLVELCDGSRTAEEVAALVRPLAPPESADSVRPWLEEAERSGLLVAVGGTDDLRHARGMGAGELADLADRLRDEGKTQAAVLCQERAVELSPGNTRYWCHLGELSHIVGNRGAARRAYERYLQLEPDDAEVRHLLVSLRDEPAPPRVPDECIRQLYERFSGFYESNMCDELGYQGPKHLYDVARPVLAGRAGLRVLDLGCGTGLAGEVFRPGASRLVGIDLSEEMLARARDRGIYDQLDHAEATAWLDGGGESFDLIVACDTFIYFGDLRQVLVPAERVLAPGGMIALSVERANGPPFRLTDSGRYEHHLDHVRQAAGSCGLRVANTRDEFLRMEYGNEVYAHFVCLVRGTDRPG